MFLSHLSLQQNVPKHVLLFTFTLSLCWRVDGYTAEEDAQFERFVRFGLDLREKFFEAAAGRQEKVFGSRQSRATSKSRATSRQRRQTRSGPGFYALPLPYLPQVGKRCRCVSKFFFENSSCTGCAFQSELYAAGKLITI